MYPQDSGPPGRRRVVHSSRPRLFDDDINVFDLEAYLLPKRRNAPVQANSQSSISPDAASNTSTVAERQSAKSTASPNKGAPEQPAWADLKTKAGKDRKRLPLACIACRRKKIRCSGEKPTCKHCLKSRVPCVYKVTTRKATPRTDYMAMLDKRLKRMEERVIRIIPRDAEKPSIPRAVVKPGPASAHSAQQSKKRRASEAFGGNLEAWLTSTAADRDPRKHMWARVADPDEARLLSEGASSLPSPEMQDHLVEVFFDYVYGQSYFLLHKPSFTRMRSIGKVPPVLLLAVCAASARFSDHPHLQTDPTFLRGDAWAKAAQSIASKRLDTPNITILTVLLILALHNFGTCQGGRSWMLSGIAYRMAYALELHKELEYDPLSSRAGQKVPFSPLDREIRRRTMWACFMMDRFNSSGTERPMFANEAFLKIQLPVREDLFMMELAGQTEMLDGSEPKTVEKASTSDLLRAGPTVGVAAFNVRIVALWGRLVQYWNLGGHERETYNIWHPESAYQVVASQVKAFEMSLPDFLQYNTDNLSMHAAQGIGNQFLFLHIAMLQVKLFLHRFAFPATWPRKPPADIPSDFLLNARDVATSTAAAISRLVEHALDYNVVVPFAGYSAYLSGAVHVHVIFAQPLGPGQESRALLTHNIKYLNRMKRYWGMFYYLTESLKELYRQYADAAGRGTLNPETRPGPKRVFQYGDWYDRYPRGVSQACYEEPAADGQPRDEAVLSQKSDLQSVEEFFASHPQPLGRRPASNKRARARAGRSGGTRGETSSRPAINMATADTTAAQTQDAGAVRPLSAVTQQDATLEADDSGLASGASSHKVASALPPSSDAANIVNLPHQPSPSTDRRIATLPAGMDTYGMGTSFLPDINAGNMAEGSLWDLDLPGLGADAFGDAANAWYIPFNVNLPDSDDAVGLSTVAADIMNPETGGQEFSWSAARPNGQ